MTTTNADFIEVERRCLAKTNNPMHAWAAYSFARVAGDPIPDWVLRYFDMAARNLFALADEVQDEGGMDMGPKIAMALKLASKGRGSPLVEYHHDWLVFGMNVRNRMQRTDSLGRSDLETYAIESVARDHNASESAVRRAYKLYDALFPGDAIFPNEAASTPD